MKTQVMRIKKKPSTKRFLYAHDTLHFEFSTKPITSNHAIGRSRNGRSFSTKKLIDFQQYIQSVLQLQEAGIELFKSNTDPIGGISVKINYKLSGYLTAKKVISLTCLDLDNASKYTIDSVFKILGINDAFITTLFTTKEHGDSDSIEMTIYR